MDCTPEFNGAMANAIYVGTYFKVRLITPLQWLSKADVVKLAADLGVPLGLTYSCYNGGEEHCGKCPTCVGRLAAFAQAGKLDPALYYTYDPAPFAGITPSEHCGQPLWMPGPQEFCGLPEGHEGAHNLNRGGE
jgi:hypothetical protein